MNAELDDWCDIACGPQWGTLVVGNGLSVNVWEKFGYASLYDSAAKGFAEPARAVFTRLGTQNFEEALAGLSLTRALTDAVGEPVSWIDPVYNQVRDGLFEAVGQVHVPWRAVPTDTLHVIGQELIKYRRVFTLNYDLLLYWAVQAEDIRTRVVDFLWSQRFDSANVEVYGGKTELFHLHGGLHLWRDALTGTTGKWTATSRNLLDDIRDRYQVEGSRQPLFVSEGGPEDKLRSIHRSDYLTFAYRGLEDDHEPTVVFGAGLGSPDQHIVDALAAGPKRPIAFSVYPPAGPESAVTVVRIKTTLMEALAGHELMFFNSTTYPLGSPQLAASV